MTRPICAIVGVGPGNGAAFARRFSDAGYDLALLSRSTEFSSNLATEIANSRAYTCDASDPTSITETFASIREDLGDVDVLIYNAGGGSWTTVEEITPEEFERGWRVNALGGLVASQQVIPAMKKKGSGSIIFVGATASLRGVPKTAGFASAKAAQRALAQSMAKHLWPAGIHVSLMIIDGGIGQPGVTSGEKLDPGDIAGLAHHLTTQPASCWSFEVDARPHKERW